VAILGGNDSEGDDQDPSGLNEIDAGESQADDEPLRDKGSASTPQWLFDYCAEMAVEMCGERITLDVAAAAWNRKCERYYTEEQDGLVQPWNAKAVWLNCPYNDQTIEAFIKKAMAERDERGTTTFALLPDWGGYDFMDLCEQHGRIHRIKGPVMFTREDGNKFVMNCGYRSSIVKVFVFGPNVQPGFGKPIIKG
jgi:phage N-6-adenine-methyltransferase